MASETSADRGEAAQETPGVGELVRQASEQMSHLVRAEMRLAAAELKDKGKHTGAGAGLLGGAGALAAYGVAALLVAVGAALALVMPVWAAALIIAVVLLAGAGLTAVAGRRQLAQGVPPTPNDTVESVKQDITEIKERAHR